MPHESLAEDSSPSVLIPYTSGCEHRERAREYVVDRYRQLHPTWELVEGRCEGEWSKGRALTDAAARAHGDVFVVADADSYIDAEVLDEAVGLITEGSAWVVPHLNVWRLRQATTAQVYAGKEPELHYGMRLDRGPYQGTVGGGITVVSREAWDTTGGVDPRFVGWGGEDLSWGRALETLCGPCIRLEGDLVHLWHPPETHLRKGSRQSEALAGRYLDAYRKPRLMRALVENREPEPLVMLDVPVHFRSRTPNLIARNGKHVIARFRRHEFSTTDPDVVAALRLHPRVEEVA